MGALPLAFSTPWVLLGLLALPIIWYLLRLTPPKPRTETFPPFVILERLTSREDTPAKSPWWLTLLRLLIAALIIIAMAGPILNPRESILRGDGPLLLVMDNGWASAGSWDLAKQSAIALLENARQRDRTAALVLTADAPDQNLTSKNPDQLIETLLATENRSIRPDHAASAQLIRNAMAERSFGEIIYYSDNLEREGSGDFLDLLTSGSALLTVFTPDNAALVALSPISNEPTKLVGEVIRPLTAQTLTAQALPLKITAHDKNGLPVATLPVIVPAGQTSARYEITQPVEIRNQITRISIEGAGNAGAVRLLDESNKRRVVGLISGQSLDISQPLLSPLYYINRALAPYSDIRIADTANLDKAVNSLLNQNVSAIIMADVGTMPETTQEKVETYLRDGGLVVRFAGPRLAANPKSALLPVALIEGDRFLGGALSWESPKTIAPFERTSPFFGLGAPADVTISRQVLARQSGDLAQRSWANLEDGTPLITARQFGNGWLVLFHVNSDNNWSNLPLSGTFVEMLRRTVNLSRSTNAMTSEDAKLRLPPLEVLDGKGNSIPPPLEVKPLVFESASALEVSIENPPGLYGTEDGYHALNLLGENESLTPLPTSSLPGNAQIVSLTTLDSLGLGYWLLLAALGLFLLDCLAMLWFAGVINRQRIRPATQTLSLLAFAIAMLILAFPTAGFAQSSDPSTTQTPAIDYSAALRTRFAYVKTGNSEIDRISEAGLVGLTRFIAARTALEPGDPIGIDVATDELAFYPFLYWAVDPEQPTPGEEAMARVDAYMKQGGSVLFDTRDALSGMLNGNSANSKLREILSSLDIPSLEPVPLDHVLTKSFYLLKSFPGRFSSGQLWIEQIPAVDERQRRPARAGDGVSTILITSNDLVGAWAVDQNNAPLLPIAPPVPGQREYAYRVGVNIVMYTLTGNYKADQVHIPALLERLGQ